MAVVALSNVQVLGHVLAYHNSLADHGQVVGLNPAVSSRQQQVDQGRLTNKAEFVPREYQRLMCTVGQTVVGVQSSCVE